MKIFLYVFFPWQDFDCSKAWNLWYATEKYILPELSESCKSKIQQYACLSINFIDDVLYFNHKCYQNVDISIFRSKYLLMHRRCVQNHDHYTLLNLVNAVKYHISVREANHIIFLSSNLHFRATLFARITFLRIT